MWGRKCQSHTHTHTQRHTHTLILHTIPYRTMPMRCRLLSIVIDAAFNFYILFAVLTAYTHFFCQFGVYDGCKNKTVQFPLRQRTLSTLNDSIMSAKLTLCIFSLSVSLYGWCIRAYEIWQRICIRIQRGWIRIHCYNHICTERRPIEWTSRIALGRTMETSSENIVRK